MQADFFGGLMRMGRVWMSDREAANGRSQSLVPKLEDVAVARRLDRAALVF